METKNQHVNVIEKVNIYFSKTVFYSREVRCDFDARDSSF